MASRQEEKEARRRERLAKEQAEQAAAARRKRAQMGFGVLLGIAALVGIVIAITSAGGSSAKKDAGAKQASDLGALPALPPQKETDLPTAAKAAGCDLQNPAYEGAGHAQKHFTEADYKTNPPTSGQHYPNWYDDGIYDDPSKIPELGQLVHTLEHGRINLQYKPGTDKQTVAKLEALVAEKPYHMLLYQNPTGMKAQVAATAWDQSLTCSTVTDKTWDALRTFRDRYIDKAPEQIP
jgi:hypothetical protein